ncbi:MAG: hypothetical protein KY476_06130 [Planctomycetes bacterium]|nr:hypothetical protein [Planctomycetota bacterium]
MTSMCRWLTICLLLLAPLLAGCGGSTAEIPDRMIVTKRYIGAGIRQDDQGLAYVDYEQSEATDGRLEKLQEVDELVEVRLSDTDATDAGIGYLSKLRMIHTIYIDGAKGVTNRALELLPAAQLKSLTIIGTRINDEGLAALKRYPGIESLAVDGLTDEGLKHLKHLPRLERLDLVNSRITDRGIPHLEAIPRLRDLVLVECEISEPVLHRLREALPGTRVQVQP